MPVFAESNLASETPRRPAARRRAASRARTTRASSTHVAERKRCKEGEALLELGLIEPKELFVALKEQVRQRLVDCFGWPRGTFRVERRATARPTSAQPFRADI